jgi:hypothetical protein
MRKIKRSEVAENQAIAEIKCNYRNFIDSRDERKILQWLNKIHYGTPEIPFTAIIDQDGAHPFHRALYVAQNIHVLLTYSSTGWIESSEVVELVD